MSTPPPAPAPTAGLDPSHVRFLGGLLTPVHDELDVADLEVEGELPDALRGTFLRNGPNPHFTPPGRYHPFDGDGMIHAVEVRDGGARYRNRWVRSRGFEAEARAGRALYGGLSEFVLPDPEVVAAAGIVKNTANTHTLRHAGRWFALMEAAPPTQITRELETVGEYDFDGHLVGGCTAHPKVDPISGELLFFGYSPFPPHLRYHRADATGALVQTVEIDLPNPVMVHDFAVTEHYVAFIDSPSIFDPIALVNGQPAMRWAPEEGTRLGVMARTGGEVTWFDIDTRYVVHFFNAWDEDDTLVVHAPAFDRMPGGFQFDDPHHSLQPFPRRWTVDLGAGTVEDRQVDDRAGEFPRIDDRRATRRHRYAYNCLPRPGGLDDFDFCGVVKYDLERDSATTYVHGDTGVSGEHVFAPDPGGQAEDDGWLLSFVTDRSTERSALVVLDARDLSAGPVARVLLPRRVPLGFHANWMPETG